MEKASACARAVKPEAEILPKKEEMPACGQRALARVSYMTGTRAKAQLTPNQTDQFHTGKLTLFAPGLTDASTVAFRWKDSLYTTVGVVEGIDL